jgi:predicted amidophosphoribosyltransferase
MTKAHVGPDGRPAPAFPRLKGRLPPRLIRCPGCGQHLFPTAKTCPHCGGALAVLRRRQLRALKQAEAAVARLASLFGAGP